MRIIGKGYREGRAEARFHTPNNGASIRLRRGITLTLAVLLLLLVPAGHALATALPKTVTEDSTITALGNPYTGETVIEPGVTVNVNAGAYFSEVEIVVKGTLTVEGTSANPVVFNGSKGHASAVAFEPGSGESVVDHAEFIKGGGSYCCLSLYPTIAIRASSPTIENSKFIQSNWQAIASNEGGGPHILGNHFIDSKSSAIVYDAGKGHTGTLDVQHNLIEGTGSSGISVRAAESSISGGMLSGNTITGAYGTGLTYSGPDVPGNITENRLLENGSDVIEISGTVAHSSTWNDGGSEVKFYSSVTVASGVTLKMTPGLYMSSVGLVVKGTLEVEGTTSNPVVFNGSQGHASSISFEPGSGASLVDHAEFIKGGGSYCCLSTYATIATKATSPTIRKSTFIEPGYQAIKSTEGGSPDIIDNRIIDSKSSAIVYEAGKGHTGTLDIRDNVVEGTSSNGISVKAAESSISGGMLNGNVITGAYNTGLTYSGPDVPGDITENTLSGNGSNVVEVSGTVAHSSTWKKGTAQVKVVSALTVASGVVLKLTPGVRLFNPALIVKGTLLTEGTAAEPVVLTGANEQLAGEWGSIKFEPGSGGSVLDRTEVAFGGSSSSSGMIEAKGSNPTITNSTIRRAKYYGVKVTESGAPRIEWNRFRANANGLSYTGTGKLFAPNNDWDCASGPKPAGCGNSVTANVEWKPAAQLPELAGHCRGIESQCGQGADPVSLATGHLTYSHRDLALTNKGDQLLEFARAYNSGSGTDSGLGPGWSQTGLASVTELGSGEVLVVRQDGRQDLFQKSEGGYEAPSGVTDALAKTEGTFRLTTLENTIYRFDASGRVASVTDDHGLKTTYGYNAEGRLATITDPSSQTLTFSYNSSNHITLVKDSTGREAKYGYSAAGDLATVTDALGGVTEYTYDAAHRLKTIKDPRGNVILKNTYDGQGRVVEQRDGLENLWLLEYKADETVVTEPEGGEITYSFDSLDRVVSEKDQLGHITTTSYDAAGNIDEILKPGAAKWSFGHDSAGNLISAIDPEGGERSYEFDGLNRLASFTDERGETWSYEWDGDNDLVKVTDPAEDEASFTHDAAGLTLTATDPNEHTTTFTYDARGNRLTEKDPLAHTTSYSYNTRSQLTAKTLPGLKAETYGRNSLGDLLSTTTPEGNKTEYTYDANGMPTQVKDPAGNLWKIERNAMERPTAYVDPLEGRTEIDYDGNLNQVAVTDRRGKETTYAYDLANQLTGIVKPEGGDWEFGYDARGNRTAMVEPRENTTAYEFDLLGRMTEAAEPLGATTTYGYDPAGNLTSFTDARENTTELGRDELGRVTEISQPLGKTTTFTYDGVGNRLTRATAAGTLEFGYDAANRLEDVSAGESVLRAFDYDPAGRLIGATDAQADEIEVGYDDDGRLTSLNDGRGQTVSREFDSRGNVVEQTDGRGVVEYEYDKLSQMIGLTDPQSKALDFGYDAEGNVTKLELSNGVVTTNEYDNAGRLAETTSAKGETTLESLDYEYDPAGNRISQIDRLSQETSYAYDALNRLTQFDPPGEGSTAYGYDPAGNRIEAGGTTFAFNALNQLTSASNGTSYDYDDAGRLIEVDQGGFSTTYDWNPLSELASVDTGSQEIDYAYDALGRQALRDDGSAIRLTHYGDLSDLPILDTDAEGKPTMSYVQGPAGLIEQRSGGEATSFPLRDAHGDITTLANGEGEVASRQSYGPWGEQLSGPGLEMGWLGAQQRRADSDVGLVQMGVRPYGPSIGSFNAEDPVLGHVGIGITTNRYPYAWDNPLNLYDLDGRDVLPGLPICILACSTEAQKEISDRTSDFVKSVKDKVSDIDIGGERECERKIIASTNPFFPCEEVEGELEYKDSEPNVIVPPYTPMGPTPSPGVFLPTPTWTPAPVPQPVYPFIP